MIINKNNYTMTTMSGSASITYLTEPVDSVSIMYLMNTIMILNIVTLYKEHNKINNNLSIKDLKIDKYYKCKLENVYCSICCENVKSNEFLRKLPCKHKFHKKCVDKWLNNLLKKSENTSCPLCRKNI
jgi:hypothetical protein